MPTALTCLYNDVAIDVDDALSLKDGDVNLAADAFRCVECGQAVRPHRTGGNASAHFEHLDRNPYCSLSHKNALSAQDADKTAETDSDWTPAELRAAIEAYFDMQRKARSEQAFVKKKYYTDLHRRFGRTEKSFEYRMQNISYVLSVMGREWLSGLKPAKNVGTAVAIQIEALIHEVEGSNAPAVISFELRTREELKRKTDQQPNGNQSPKASTASVTQYQRDPYVKAWVLKHTKGICECCGHPAPFNGSDGLPFLEVHHVHHLSDQGPDTTSNTVALCPNCHREVHYGANSKRLVERLYESVERLQK
jgi:5-methylcytosine-specific restriction enzyme A